MKKICVVLLVLVVILAVLVGARQIRESKRESQALVLGTPGTYEQTVVSGDRNRQYLLHIPATYTQGAPTPLVLFYHGGGGGMKQAAADYNWIEKSEQAGFIVVFMQGTSRHNTSLLNTWNAGECCAYARDNNIDDVQYTKDVLAAIVTTVTIDTEKIFATGFSNGAMMSHRLACEMSDTFAAIGAVSGTDNTQSCEPTVPISIMHIHAKNDDAAKYDGGSGRTFEDNPERDTDFTSVRTTIDRWLNRNGIMSDATRVLEVPGAVCDRYTDENTVMVELCALDEGGHTWPGSDGAARHSGLVPSQALDATDVLWGFFMEAVTE
jgi:polyhydroxybutyrate depolymerase